jgi:hypothetical protein
MRWFMFLAVFFAISSVSAVGLIKQDPLVNVVNSTVGVVRSLSFVVRGDDIPDAVLFFANVNDTRGLFSNGLSVVNYSSNISAYDFFPVRESIVVSAAGDYLVEYGVVVQPSSGGTIQQVMQNTFVLHVSGYDNYTNISNNTNISNIYDLQISTNVGARIYLDGGLIGIAPVNVQVSGGNHVVKAVASLGNYYDFTNSYFINYDQNISVNLQSVQVASSEGGGSGGGGGGGGGYFPSSTPSCVDGTLVFMNASWVCKKKSDVTSANMSVNDVQKSVPKVSDNKSNMVSSSKGNDVAVVQQSDAVHGVETTNASLNSTSMVEKSGGNDEDKRTIYIVLGIGAISFMVHMFTLGSKGMRI